MKIIGYIVKVYPFRNTPLLPWFITKYRPVL